MHPAVPAGAFNSWVHRFRPGESRGKQSPMEACALIIPRPMQLEPLPGQFILTPEVRIGIPPGADEDVRFAGRVLREAVLSATGLELALLEETADANGGASSAPAGGILLTTSGAPAGLGNEGYEL